MSYSNWRIPKSKIFEPNFCSYYLITDVKSSSSIHFLIGYITGAILVRSLLLSKLKAPIGPSRFPSNNLTSSALMNQGLVYSAHKNEAFWFEELAQQKSKILFAHRAVTCKTYYSEELLLEQSKRIKYTNPLILARQKGGEYNILFAASFWQRFRNLACIWLPVWALSNASDRWPAPQKWKTRRNSAPKNQMLRLCLYLPIFQS